MTPSQLQILVQLVSQEPYVNMDDREAAQAINLATTTQRINRRMDGRDLLREWGDPTAAEAFLQKLITVGESNNVVKRAVSWLKPAEGGLDINDVNVLGIIDHLAAINAITSIERDKFYSFGDQTVKLIDSLGLPSLHDTDIKEARA